MKIFPFKIVGRLLTGMKEHTESITINDKLFKFTWSVNTFYNLLDKSNTLGVEVNLKNATIDGIPMTDSYKRNFTSSKAIGKMENIVTHIVKTKINSRIHKISKDINVEYLEFNFEQ